jgi:hypothetical protein
VGQAVVLLGAGNYAAAFTQCYAAYRYVTAVRAAVPDLPALT